MDDIYRFFLMEVCIGVDSVEKVLSDIVAKEVEVWYRDGMKSGVGGDDGGEAEDGALDLGGGVVVRLEAKSTASINFNKSKSSEVVVEETAGTGLSRRKLLRNKIQIESTDANKDKHENNGPPRAGCL